MPVISFASSKGGVGKTTAAALLGGEIAAAGRRVSIIDADPNEPISKWAAMRGCPKEITVVSGINQENILDIIDARAKKDPFVLVDLEGTANLTVGYAISKSDLVLIPLRGSQLDANEAGRAIQLIRRTEAQVNRSIDHAVVFTGTSPAIRPRTLTHLVSEFEKAGIPILQTQILERDAFRAVFSFGGTLHGLAADEVANIEPAKINALAFADEVMKRVGQGSKRKQGRAAA